ncbi:MAG TPA: universal stress protein [Cyclobacteriaceae bacterium]|nr:universal stress protein [Cyclobacteriaceae bacterium]
MKRILVPCDFSTQARQAYTFALDIAKKTNAEIYVLHAVDVPFMYSSYSPEVPSYLTQEGWDRLTADAKQRFQEMKGEHARQNDISLRIEIGPATMTILNFIETNQIDLVVMGTKGVSGFDEMVIGSNTEKVVRFSKVPVFVVKKAVNLSSIKSIVLPTTLELNQSAFMNKVKELQKMFGATLRLLVINTPGSKKKIRDENAELRDFADHYKLEKFQFDIQDAENVEDGILHFVHQTKSDMIAMGTHSRKGLSHLFMGSVTEDLVNHMDCPIWTFTIKK